MGDSADLKNFLEKIMQVKVVEMGGAKAGILGFSDVNTITINDLKKNAIAFAREYSKPKPDQDKLSNTANLLSGNLQTLQLTGTLSELTTDSLLDELDSLMKIS